VLPGAFFPVETEQDSRDRAVSELQWRVQKARDAGLVLGIEAHIGSIAPTPAAAKRLVEAVPGLTLTLDYTHFARTGIPDSDVEPLIEHAAHFHVRGACEGRLQTGFAENSIDYERVVQRMDEVGYRGWLGIEYVRTEWERCNECDNLSETILFRDFLRDLM
jgi:sugar phosphate isomerase/epimerase